MGELCVEPLPFGFHTRLLLRRKRRKDRRERKVRRLVRIGRKIVKLVFRLRAVVDIIVDGILPTRFGDAADTVGAGNIEVQVVVGEVDEILDAGVRVADDRRQILSLEDPCGGASCIRVMAFIKPLERMHLVTGCLSIQG